MNPISEWLSAYSRNNGDRCFVVGVSGGVDSALTSTLCGETGLRTIAVSMPIHQSTAELALAQRHLAWLADRYRNATTMEVDLTEVYDSFEQLFSQEADTPLALANTRARLRMTALYQIATSSNGFVVGTGNKVEDFGVGFFTKYGDGGVDISPIADLLKSEVRQMARELGILEEIVGAAPTDGLWPDGRTDEDQLGATYDELEWAMAYDASDSTSPLSEHQQQVLSLYRHRRAANRHKMIPIPVYKKP